jgi:PAS domain S-box-containing protein
MARTPTEGLQNDIRVLLRTNPKGLSIEEISTRLSISRTTTAKYLNAMEQTGQIESRPYGPAKVYTLTERIPLDNLVSILPYMIIVLSDSLTILQVNNALLDFFKLEKNDLAGRDLRYTSLGSYLNDSRLQILQDAIEGIPQFIEEDITIEGTTSFFTIRIIPTLFENGGKGIVIVFEDITALKNAQIHLEELVEKRTSELEKVNKKLSEENTKYRKVREQLALKEHQYEQLVENSTDLILKFSSDGILIFYNLTAGSVLGIDSSQNKEYQFIGSCIPDNPSNQEFADSLISSLISDPTVIKKKEIEYLDGKEPIWISWTFRNISSQITSAPEILCIGTEITERILSERRHTKSEQQLSEILSHLPDPTFVINPQRKIVLWNKAMEEMTGVEAEAVVGKERTFFTPSIFGYSRPILADLIFDPDSEEYVKYFQNLLKEEEVLTAETTGIGKKGEEVIFWVKVTPLKDENEQAIGAIQSMRDITSIKALEASLIQSEGLVRGILEASKDLIVVLDHEKRYSFLNSAYEKVFRCNIGELKGKSILDIPLPGDPEVWNRSIDSLIQTRLSNRVEVPYSHDSHDYWLDCYLVPFSPPPTGKMHILLEIRDVSGLKGGNTALWKEETALQEIGKQVSRLIPTLNMSNCMVLLPVIAIMLLAFTGNYFY